MQRVAPFHAAGITLAALLLIGSEAGWGQVTSATIYGRVTDPSASVIPGAKIALRNERTEAEAFKTTTGAGDFQFDFVPAGSYTLTIEAEGFKKYQATGMDLAAGQNVRRAYTLEVGRHTELVVVEGATPLVNTVSAEQFLSFDSKRVEELPLLRRNFTNLLKIGTGVTPAEGGSGDGIRMNGIGRNGTAYSVDGGEASTNIEGRGTTTYELAGYPGIISIEAIREVHTVKGIVSAEYGNLVGGQVQIVTKSGTNEWHGSLFENFQSDSLNARHGLYHGKAPVTYNQFGGSIGGPIQRNKVFIFAVYEGYREKNFTQLYQEVPTQGHRNRLLAAQPIYKPVLELFPLPNRRFDADAPCLPAGESPTGRDLTAGCTGVFSNPGSTERRDNHVDVKGDIRLTDSSTLSLSYIRGRPFRLVPSIFLNGSNDRHWSNWQEKGIAAFTTGGPDWTSETRFAYNLNEVERWDRFFREGLDPDNPNEEQEFDRRLGRIRTNLGWRGPQAESFLAEGYVWSLEEKFAKHVGGHSLKFGARYMRHCCLRTNPENPRFEYTGLEALLNNSPSAVQPTFGSGQFKGRMYEVSGFIQDDWRVRSNLTLNIGLRYDFFSNMRADEVDGSTAGFFNADGLLDDQFHFGPIRDPSNPYEHDAVNFGPRFSFSYNPGGQGKTVIRGGFGVLFSNQMAGAMWQSVSRRNIPFRVRFTRSDVDRLGLKYGVFNDTLRRIVQQEAAASDVVNAFSYFDPEIENPYAMHWLFGVQRELTPNTVFESSYVGNGGRKFLMHRRPNQVIRTGPLAGQTPNPRLRMGGFYVDHSQTTSYHSWQTSLRKRYSRNFTGSFHYTWGKSLSTGGGDVGAYYQGDNGSQEQDFFNLAAERGPSSGDVTHYVAAEWLWNAPTFSRLKSSIARHVLGGWQISGILTANTGQSVTFRQGSALSNSRPDYVGGAPTLDGYRDTRQYLNRQAFEKVPLDPVSFATIRPGNTGRGAIRLPGQWNVDFSVGKNFSLSERIRLRFRADMFNAFNHVNLTGLNRNIDSSRFGSLNDTTGARTMQLNARLTW